MWNPPDSEAFFAVVWTIVQQIPEGRVSTYGQIAAMIPPPDGVEPPAYARLGSRWVGMAMNATPPGKGIPWQRVINSRGTISLPPESPAAQEQRALLQAEGVVFGEKDAVDFEEFGWEGPAAEWLREHGLYPPPSLRKRNKKSSESQPRLF